MQSKQPRKPHKAVEETHLAPLELMHSDICETNGVLTKGGQPIHNMPTLLLAHVLGHVRDLVP
jgi:hypothetical protein